MLRNTSRLFARMCSSHVALAKSATMPRQVLPSDLVPQHYRVVLEPDLEKFTFTGEVEIDLDVKKPTKSVSVNILDLLIKDVSVEGKAPTATSTDEDSQSITWTFADEITKPTTIKVGFEGELNDKLAGFYRSVHKDENGVQKVVATTQMEATDCRRAFPCFDEPNLKATFDISLIADKKFTALSNMDVKATAEVDGKVRTDFNTTPKMSTYLVAFIVGEMNYVESNYFRVPVRVYATPGLETRCQFSADLAARTLEFFEKTFGIEYPLPKCDMVGIHDFSAGAMENWGLITYRVVDLFFTEGQDPANTKMRVAEVVQHELAHQWFGNLVTMDWWDGLWLNEGFATWMSWYSSNHFFPGWKVWEAYVSVQYQHCLNLDGLRSSHPIQVPVQRADEISQIFDAISYMKGSCVIRMISQYLGEETFMEGIRLYLKRHQFKNTETEDLWSALSEVSGKDVRGQMDIWTKKIGYPIVTVQEDGKVKVTQNRYLRTGDVAASEDETLYPVWLGVRGADGKIDHSKVLNTRSEELDIDTSDFYKLNGDQNGIFRVKYPESRIESFAAEGKSANNGRLTPEDRIGLLSDLGALSGSYAKTSTGLTVIDAWKGTETESNVWSMMLNILGTVRGNWRDVDTEIRDALRAFSRDVVGPKCKEVGWTFSSADSFQDETLKTSLFNTSVATEVKEVVDAALKLFQENEFKDINPNIRSATFSAVAEHGSKEQWEQLFQIYLDGTHGITGNAALGAIGSTKDLDLKKKVLSSILDGSIRSQDAYLALVGVAGDKQGLDLVWEWTQREWPQITERFPPSLGLLGRFVSIFSMFSSEQHLKEFSEFYDNQNTKGIDQQIGIVKDKIRTAINWANADTEDVRAWLKAHNYL